MDTVTAVLILLAGGIAVFYKLANTAIHRRANVRAGARLGPGSFFLEVTDQKPEEPQLPEE
jgi:hypothetical protein